jgi:hypothetical protein
MKSRSHGSNVTGLKLSSKCDVITTSMCIPVYSLSWPWWLSLTRELRHLLVLYSVWCTPKSNKDSWLLIQTIILLDANQSPMIVHYHQQTTYNYRFGYRIPTATQLAQPRRLA